MMATTPFMLTEAIGLSAIPEPAVLGYFETFNRGDFEATASLFDAEGVLHAPFADPIVGKSAIATYLKTEALGMKLNPQQGMSQTLEDGNIQVQVNGLVQTAVFRVNVGWLFIVNSQPAIVSATVKLLASPQELLSLRPFTKL
ncbi:nuclear transport factor 2 family protein [Microcoleus sp.]|uniref:nuclear transport factor 2 family protein n=1 Tax=Microcoleus sp. TaxID=44472 RepID=UPI0035248D1D